LKVHLSSCLKSQPERCPAQWRDKKLDTKAAGKVCFKHGVKANIKQRKQAKLPETKGWAKKDVLN